MQNYHFLYKHITKCELDPVNYNPLGHGRNGPSSELNAIQRRYPCTQSYPCPESIKISVWAFFAAVDEVNNFMNILDVFEMQKFLENKIGEYPKGACRIMLIDLLCSIRKFVIKMNFNPEQIATLYSIFLLTHEFFTSSIYISAETVFQYFKDFLTIHSADLYPECREIFSNDKCTTKILEYFAKLYLRHLPLIRLLSRPNFSYNVAYELPVETSFNKIKKGKSDKKSKDKKSKKSKKSKK